MTRITITGDSSVAVVFGTEIGEEINARIRCFDQRLQEAGIPGIVETVPTYCTLLVHYDPEVILYSELKLKLELLLQAAQFSERGKCTVVEIPVCYGGEYGEDLAFVAQHCGMTEQDVIRIHSGGEYRIYMLGFTPGFPYMGGMDEAIAAPRLTTPRTRIPAGSVGIAGSQTGIYPLDSPGGWQLIGRTPVRLYDPQKQQPILLDAGMKVRFVPISPAEFERIRLAVEEGSFTCRTFEEG